MINRAAFEKAAHRLRKLGFVHKILYWGRNRLFAGLREGLLEFSRVLWSDNPTFGPPKGCFSLHQSLRTGDPSLEGKILITDQGVPKVDPNSLLVRSGFRQHKEQPWAVFWCALPNATLVSESLAYLDSSKRVALESVYGFERLREDPAYRFFRLPPAVKLSGRWTSIVSMQAPTDLRSNHTHWIMDALPRLAMLSQLPPDTKILVPAQLAGWQKETLQLLGVWERCRPTSERHLQIEQYYFCSPTAMLDCFNPYGVKFLREELLSRRDQSYHGPKKFVLKRSGKWREPDNSEEIYSFFEQIGWAVVDTEKMSFAQELNLFYEAEVVVGVLGSGLTNVVFCQPGCAVLHIVPGFYLDGWVDWIVQVVGCKYDFFICPSNYQQKYRVDIETLRQALLKLTGKPL